MEQEPKQPREPRNDYRDFPVAQRISRPRKFPTLITVIGIIVIISGLVYLLMK